VTQYVVWKTDASEPRIPEFEEVRGQVEAAWKTLKARELAAEKAESMVTQAKSLDESAWSAILDETEMELLVSPPSFTWMQSNRMFQRPPSISRIDGIEAGESMMESIFSTATSDFGDAMNEVGTIHYIFQVVGRSPTDEQLESRFAASPRLPDSNQVAEQRDQVVLDSWIQERFDAMGVKYSDIPFE
jgi:hypothetical protein